MKEDVKDKTFGNIVSDYFAKALMLDLRKRYVSWCDWMWLEYFCNVSCGNDHCGKKPS